LVSLPAVESVNEFLSHGRLVIDSTAGLRNQTLEVYEEQVKYLTYLVNQHQVPKVIFISSTSYYPSLNDWVDINTPPDLDKGSSKAVVQGEIQMRKANGELLILRCGGLMGAGRIPGRWFAGKATKGAQTPVNYIHQQDLIAAMTTLIEANSWTQSVMNMVSPEHPTRQAVHEAMADKYGFEYPLGQAPEIIPHKLVKSDLEQLVLKPLSPLNY